MPCTMSQPVQHRQVGKGRRAGQGGAGWGRAGRAGVRVPALLRAGFARRRTVRGCLWANPPGAHSRRASFPLPARPALTLPRTRPRARARDGRRQPKHRRRTRAWRQRQVIPPCLAASRPPYLRPRLTLATARSSPGGDGAHQSAHQRHRLEPAPAARRARRGRQCLHAADLAELVPGARGRSGVGERGVWGVGSGEWEVRSGE